MAFKTMKHILNEKLVKNSSLVLFAIEVDSFYPQWKTIQDSLSYSHCALLTIAKHIFGELV